GHVMQSAIPGAKPQTGPQVSVGGAPVSALAGGFAANQQLAKTGVTVQAASTNGASIFVGGADVAVNHGVELEPGAAWTYPIENPADIYAIAASGTQAMNVTWV